MTGAVAAGALLAAAVLVAALPGRSRVPVSAPRPTPRRPGRRRQGRRARRARAAAVAEALTVLDSVGPALRAGLAPPTALAHLAANSPRRGGLVDDLAEAAGGSAQSGLQPARASPIGRVWSHWAQRSGAEELQLVAAAWTLADVSGVALADAVDLAARLLREARARQARLDVLLAGPRATMTLLTLLPIAGPVVGLLFGIGPLTLYAGSSLSVLAAGCGIGLMVAGRLWCQRLLRGALSAGAAAGRSRSDRCDGSEPPPNPPPEQTGSP